MKQVVIIGGGIVGMSAAYRLVRHGIQAIVVDRSDQGKATAAGAGILSPSNRFLSSDPVLPLIKGAHAYFSELLVHLAEDGESQTGYEKIGALHIAMTDEEAAQMPQLLEQIQARRVSGFEHIGDAKVISADAAKLFFPALSPVKAAIHIPDAARVDGNLLCAALKRTACRQGATVLQGDAGLIAEGKKVAAIAVAGQTISADAVIVTAGAWSNQLIRTPSGAVFWSDRC